MREEGPVWEEDTFCPSKIGEEVWQEEGDDLLSKKLELAL